jgi:hypothetical protein
MGACAVQAPRGQVLTGWWSLKNSATTPIQLRETDRRITSWLRGRFAGVEGFDYFFLAWLLGHILSEGAFFPGSGFGSYWSIPEELHWDDNRGVFLKRADRTRRLIDR